MFKMSTQVIKNKNYSHYVGKLFFIEFPSNFSNILHTTTMHAYYSLMERIQNINERVTADSRERKKREEGGETEREERERE